MDRRARSIGIPLDRHSLSLQTGIHSSRHLGLENRRHLFQRRRFLGVGGRKGSHRREIFRAVGLNALPLRSRCEIQRGSEACA